MANPANAFGFRPLLHGTGHAAATPYAVLVGNGRIITVNDLAAIVADGGVTLPNNAGGGQAVTRGQASDGAVGGVATTNLLLGSVLHLFYVDAGNVARPSARIPASQAGTAYVIDDMNQRYVSAARDTATASQLTDLGNTADIFDSTAAVSFATPQGTLGGISQQGIDLATLSSSAAANLRLHGRYGVTNNAFGTSTTDNLHGQYVCTINEHYHRTNLVGI